jgi:hypothetical protein
VRAKLAKPRRGDKKRGQESTFRNERLERTAIDLQESLSRLEETLLRVKGASRALRAEIEATRGVTRQQQRRLRTESENPDNWLPADSTPNKPA